MDISWGWKKDEYSFGLYIKTQSFSYSLCVIQEIVSLVTQKGVSQLMLTLL